MSSTFAFFDLNCGKLDTSDTYNTHVGVFLAIRLWAH